MRFQNIPENNYLNSVFQDELTLPMYRNVHDTYEKWFMKITSSEEEKKIFCQTDTVK